MRGRATLLGAAAALLLSLGACGSGEPAAGSQVGKPATISHIHGLGVDATGALHVATHLGLIKQSGSSWVYASGDSNDHMGFSLHASDGVMYRSGHSLKKPSLGIESSTDGASWTHLSDVGDPPVDFHSMAVSFADSHTLWGSDSGGQGTFRSTDGGKSWMRLAMKGLEQQIYVLAGTAEANVVLAGTATGMYRSDDGGESWTAVDGLGKGWVLGIAADPTDPKRAITATYRGIMTTADAGRSWAPALGGIPPKAELASLAISPVDPKVAYAADASTIYTSTDGGRHWRVIYPES